MNQNDAYAPVMAPLFAGPGDQPPFTADWSNRDNGLIYQTNPAKGQGAAESAKMDFTRPDAVNTAVLNLILWRDRMGSTPMPAPKHTVFPQKRAQTRTEPRSCGDGSLTRPAEGSAGLLGRPPIKPSCARPDSRGRLSQRGHLPQNSRRAALVLDGSGPVPTRARLPGCCFSRIYVGE